MITWVKKTAGQDFAQSMEDPSMKVVGSPSWVRLPADLGGKEERVVAIEPDVCPICKNVSHTHYVLANGMTVAECPANGFLFYHYRKQA